MIKKLCVLGGGSLNTPLLVEALSTHRDADLDELCLFDINEPVLRTVADFCRFLAQRDGLSTRITESASLDEAVDGATHILNMMRVGGRRADMEDRRWLAMSGITGHAASYAEACRMLPVIVPYLAVIEKKAPDALFINFANPVSIISRAASGLSKLNFVGLCYHSTMIKYDFAALLGAQAADLEITTYGINHFSWITDARVKGESRFRELTGAIRNRRIKAYNYEQIGQLNAIPIGHAFSVYHRNGRYFAYEKGIRGNLEDLVYKFFIPRSLSSARISAGQARLVAAYRAHEPSVIAGLEASAPWYKKCIVPFLADLHRKSAVEYLLTVGRPADERLPQGAYEMPCRVGNNRVEPKKGIDKIPDFILNAVRNIIDSEGLMVRAIMDRSYAAAIQSLLMNPGVFSPARAAKFWYHYSSLP